MNGELIDCGSRQGDAQLSGTRSNDLLPLFCTDHHAVIPSCHRFDLASLNQEETLVDADAADLTRIGYTFKHLQDAVLFQGGHALLDGQFADFVVTNAST